MNEKAEEERREIEAKLEEIRQNHFAKIVLRRWKKYVKKNKMNKGKKDQQKKKRKWKIWQWYLIQFSASFFTSWFSLNEFALIMDKHEFESF